MARRRAVARTGTTAGGLRNLRLGQLELGSCARSSRPENGCNSAECRRDHALTLFQTHTAVPISQV